MIVQSASDRRALLVLRPLLVLLGLDRDREAAACLLRSPDLKLRKKQGGHNLYGKRNLGLSRVNSHSFDSKVETYFVATADGEHAVVAQARGDGLGAR